MIQNGISLKIEYPESTHTFNFLVFWRWQNRVKSVLGVIESKRVEKDGDYHIRVKLDPPFSNLINSANMKNQFGDLVVEPICVNRVTQADAISACQNFHQNISIPSIGSHVNITGSYVLDTEHGNWAEIHPVTSITKIP